MNEDPAGTILRRAKDPYILSVVAFLLVAVGLDYLPILTPEQRETFAIYYAQPPLALLAVLAIAFVVGRSKSRQEKLFWVWMLLGFSSLSGTLIGFGFLRDDPRFGVANLLVGALGPAAILCALIAAAQDAHLREDPSGQADLRRNRAVGYSVLAVALLFYFVVIPTKLDPEHYSMWYPEALPYLLLECIAVVRFLFLLIGCSSRKWRIIYGGMAVCFACWAFGDILYLLDDANIWKIRLGTVEDLWFYLPYIPLLLAIRSGDSDETTPIEPASVRRSRFAGITSQIPSSALLLLLPVMHIALIWLTPTLARVQFYRGILVLAVSPVLLLLAWRERSVLRGQSIQAHARIEQSERLFENLFERAPQAHYLIDMQGRFVSGNLAAEKMIGHSRHELIGRHIATSGLVSGDYALKALAALAKNALGQEIDDMEMMLKHKDGSQVPVEIRAFPIEYSGRRLILGMAFDITERKRMEEQLQLRLEERTAELREANARYRQVVDQVPAVTYISELGCTGKCQYVSRQTESMFGFTPTEWMSEPAFWFEHVHPDDRGRVQAQEESCIQGGFYQIEYRFRTKNLGYRWVRDEARVFAGPDGVLLLHGILLDIHEAKLLEEQLRQAQKLEAIGQLAGGIAHDFNNILNIIMGYSEFLLSPKSPPAMREEGLTKILDATKRGGSLTQQLLAFSRKQILQTRVIDLNRALSAVQEMLSRVIGEDIELVTSFHCSAASIEADPTQIERMLINLAINAREAMPGGGRLLMETSNVGPEDLLLLPESSRNSAQHVRLTITDTGSGMDAETINHVFEPFFTTKERGQGTGLGLAQVYGIVQQSNGSISVSSTPGKGSEFRVYFPLVESKPEVEAPPSIPVAGGTETILLVEDLNELREITATFLESAGYTVLEAETPAKALEISNSFSGPIDLLVTDVIMPGMNGRQLADALVANRSTMKVIFISGYTDDKIAGTGLQQATVRFLPKPFTHEQLALIVRQTLDQAQG